jgi:hypothetical protein
MTLLKGFAAGLAILVLWGLLLIHISRQVSPETHGWYALDTESLWAFCQLVFGIGLGAFLPMAALRIWAAWIRPIT